MTNEHRKNLIKWREELASGKYSQCQGKLRGETGYCCLGVLLDIFEPNQWTKRSPNSNRFCHPKGINMETEIQREEFYKLTGLKKQDYFIQLNDNADNFDEVIQYIDILLDETT